jgi:polygalacturonase
MPSPPSLRTFIRSVELPTITSVNGWVDVTASAYGAIGNGTFDCTSAINAAIAAMPGAGSVLYFPPGAYRIISAISLPSNITVMGCGSGVSSIVNTETASFTTLFQTASNATNVEIIGLGFKYTHVATTTSYALQLQAGGSAIRLSDVTITNACYGISMVDCTQVRLENISMTGIYFIGVNINGSSTGSMDISCDHIVIENLSTSGYGFFTAYGPSYSAGTNSTAALGNQRIYLTDCGRFQLV